MSPETFSTEENYKFCAPGIESTGQHSYSKGFEASSIYRNSNAALRRCIALAAPARLQTEISIPPAATCARHNRTKSSPLKSPPACGNIARNSPELLRTSESVEFIQQSHEPCKLAYFKFLFRPLLYRDTFFFGKRQVGCLIIKESW